MDANVRKLPDIGANCTLSFTIVAVIFLCFFIVPPTSNANHQEIVNKWASQLGDELNWLAKNMTKADEIKKQYKENNAKVENKGDLIRDAVKNVGQMFRRKTIAVRCIANKAEELAEDFVKNYTNSKNGTNGELQAKRSTFKYYSSKYSTINDVPCENRTETQKQCTSFKILKTSKESYKNMTLRRDKHFYHISVNTNYTSVHVPTNVFDGSDKTKDVLIWSEDLDSVFVKNYETDPALSWQYFGSQTGVLRHFPAKSWEDRDTSSSVDVYDCRKRSWYIETATCSKDIVMLLDVTGSMTGYLGYVAKLTIKSILETFSNNDFFNIYKFSVDTQPLVSCFNGTLVQATPENIDKFIDELMKIDNSTLCGNANDSSIENALTTAFDLLQKYRDKRGCSPRKPCNQAIMLITDNIQGNFTKLFEDKNHKHKTPVRIFTYLLGKDQSNVAEMQNIACANRGAFAHIQTLDEVQEKVLDYVSTIAMPLVLQGVKHPPTWTHAFKDVTYRDEETYAAEHGKQDENLSPRLMIAVGVPAYNISSENGTRKYINLLGVASTDVPVDDIDKLTLPYKLGVNAYPFIVSNNGYVLLHQDLRPVEILKTKENQIIKEHPECQKSDTKSKCVILKKNYNSIDFTEVEQIIEDDEVDIKNDQDCQPLRQSIGAKLKGLRAKSLSHTHEEEKNVKVRFHYDKMRRVSIEEYDYFFAPLDTTPFTLGLAIPSNGQTIIKVGDEIENNKNKNLNMSDLFVGQNWKVHPDWVYCKFHYMEFKSFNNSEEELLFFVNSLYNSSWRWNTQYGNDIPQDEGDEEQPNCDRNTYRFEDHYCNKELVELLIFDARVTNTSYGTWKYESDEIEKLIKSYNASLRFVATMSGLTRWQFIEGEVEKDDDKEFGDYYTKSIDETFYKSAVLQHSVANESFVYAVPHDDKDEEKEEGDIKVMASHAIFRMDAGKKAPGCVVGFQFPQIEMHKRFMDISNHPNLNCGDEIHDCYIIDNNGYIIVSSRYNINNTGRFFGDVEPFAMKILADKAIFKSIIVYDYQAICKKLLKTTEAPTSFGSTLLTPIQVLKRGLQLIVTEIVLYMFEMNLWAEAEGVSDFGDVSMQKNDSHSDHVEEYELESCDKRAKLYLLQPEKIVSPICTKKDADHSNCNFMYLSQVKLSNLLMVVVANTVRNSANPNDIEDMGAEPKPIRYSSDAPCYKLDLNSLPRRRLDDCFTEDEDENFEHVCADGYSFRVNDSYFYSISWITTMLLVFSSFLPVH